MRNRCSIWFQRYRAFEKTAFRSYHNLCFAHLNLYSYGGWRKFLSDFGMIEPLALRPCALLRRWGFQHIPSIACRIVRTCAFCNQNHVFFINHNRNARNYVAWLFAVIGGSATIRPRFMEPALAPFLLRMSCADLALSVRLGFLTKHYIVVDLLMKDLFQKGFNDIYIAV